MECTWNCNRHHKRWQGYLQKRVWLQRPQKKEPVTSSTLFSIASSTKAFTSTGIGLLVDEGKLSWDKPVRSYFPNFQLSDTMASNNATLIDILCHRTGLPGHEMMQIAIAKQFDRREIVKRLKFLGFHNHFGLNFYIKIRCIKLPLL